MKQRRSVRTAVMLASVFAVFPACEKMTVTAVDVAHIVVDPSNTQLMVGSSRQLQVRLLDVAGNELKPRSVAWSSSDAGRVQINEDGRIVGVNPGSATIWAIVGGLSGSSQVNVMPGPALHSQPDRVTFALDQGSSNQPAVNVAITDGGTRLSGLRTTIAYGAAGGWLSAALDGNSTPTTLVLRAAAGTRAPGTYAATITVTSASTSRAIPVEMNITPAAPAAPTNLQVNVKGSDRLELKWNDNSSTESNFVVERASAGSGPWAFSVTLPPNTTQYLNTGLQKDTRYWYRVRACNAAGCATSAVVSGKTNN